jgi:ubiquitin carboxyl-terminal hydrolase 9/24
VAQEQPPSGTQQRTPGPVVTYRHEVINRLQQAHALVILIAENLTQYMTRVRQALSGQGAGAAVLDPNEYAPDGRYSHSAQLSERLNFLRFLLRDGQLWLCAPQVGVRPRK